jgi:U3 small nucleolar RNA-associated protein 12
MGDLPADKYVLNVVEKVRANDLEEALLVLPFSQVLSLINYLDQWAKKVSHTSQCIDTLAVVCNN